MEKSDQQEDKGSQKKKETYDRAILLIQYQVQLFWLVFGAFLISETVLLGGIASIAKDGPATLVLGGAIFGTFLCIPWWFTFQYNHAFYLLRIFEAKSCEPEEGTFFEEGENLRNGKTEHGVSIPNYVKLLRPYRAISLLIILYGLAFLGIIIFYLFDFLKLRLFCSYLN